MRCFGVSLVALAAAAGCEGASVQAMQSFPWHSVPRQSDPAPGGGYPSEIEYKILAVARGEACMTAGHGTMDQLLKEAEYKAIESVPDADDVMLPRTRWTSDGGKICVQLSGRAYRIVRLHARQGSSKASGDGN